MSTEERVLIKAAKRLLIYLEHAEHGTLGASGLGAHEDLFARRELKAAIRDCEDAQVRGELVDRR